MCMDMHQNNEDYTQRGIERRLNHEKWRSNLSILASYVNNEMGFSRCLSAKGTYRISACQRTHLRRLDDNSLLYVLV
jgi:hypothetical protein